MKEIKDWRIKYYMDCIITEYNRHILKNYSNKKFIDTKFVNHLYKKEKLKNKGLDKLDILKKILKDVKEGKYDKN